MYHRFASRDHLAASLWMRTVERFDDEVVAAMAGPGDPLEVAAAVAIRVVEWSIENPLDACILTMFRHTARGYASMPAKDQVSRLVIRARCRLSPNTASIASASEVARRDGCSNDLLTSRSTAR